MNDNQLLRYNRQIMLSQVDIIGQERLLSSHVLIIGLGGLGSPVAMYLAAAGVGRLTLVDFDRVDLSNLQRQIIHTTSDIGKLKVNSAADTLHTLNPETQITTLSLRLEDEALTQAVNNADLVVDASDNFATRFAINRACVETGTPLVSGAAIRLEGQVTVFTNRGDNTPCYQCLYDDIPEQEARCSETGILASVVGIIGSIQATETIKILAKLGTPLAGRLLILDATNLEFREIRLRRDPHCLVCGDGQKRRVTNL
jgi:adenylyltransferase/sulfurtransferase